MGHVVLLSYSPSILAKTDADNDVLPPAYEERLDDVYIHTFDLYHQYPCIGYWHLKTLPLSHIHMILPSSWRSLIPLKPSPKSSFLRDSARTIWSSDEAIMKICLRAVDALIRNTTTPPTDTGREFISHMSMVKLCKRFWSVIFCDLKSTGYSILRCLILKSSFLRFFWLNRNTLSLVTIKLTSL